MDFITAVRTAFEKYATFSGTAARPEYWWFVLFLLLGNLVFGALDNLLFGSQSQILGALFSLGTLLPALAVGARRLHDIGRSGWWLLIALIPLIGTLVLIWWFIQPSKPDDNPFA